MTQASATDIKVALVTGAAGGLGQALVRQLRAEGWRVAAGEHRRKTWKAEKDLLPLPLDVTDPEAAPRAVAAVLGQWGRLDLLVHNAGLAADETLPRLAEADWDRVMAVNLRGVFLCARAAWEPMLRQREGQIVMIGSHAGRTGARGQANYAAAKAALTGFALSLAREAGPENVRVNVVLPGVMRTGMTEGLLPAVLEGFTAANVLGRLNDPAEVARFVTFLAGTRNISGQVFSLDSRITRWC